MKNTYIMITGPAASGKSALCEKVCSDLPAMFYKPIQAYFDLAKINNISRDRIFIDTNVNDVYNYFCNICQKHDVVVGDQHLAIQPKKDSALALNQLLLVDSNEPYVSAIDYSLFDKMIDIDIKPIIIYLSTSPELLYERAYKRYIDTGMPLRNNCLQEVIDEINAEEYYFYELINKKKLDNLIINTDIYDSEGVYCEVKKKVLKYTNK